ncbi:alpha-ketoglutarate-dependent dioxygenase AlkB family protein [Roseibacillus persicicus]|uniref:alpha-ketoglutarate-dependent dioxygenase AlkB family protein n=1 Tax=Roseibacillus persicicus TaxID=454148 RepID=UPI00280E5ADC|nr:alpha-ketoglutarate-dependent dioxygenase AlkB [Roseibacillus persicicus]MDQ8188787.1 alpha-ketoglutarate-dependent dioxygenase AlkB [Roseibacillus persicicus]
MAEQFQLGFDPPGPRLPYQVLPRDGEAIYYGKIVSGEEADGLLQTLLNEVPWRHDETVMFGKRIVTARQVAWYGDQDYDYTYSGHTHTALEWSAPLLQLKERVEEAAGASYNSCLLNLYQDGNQGMGWHQDNEKELGPQPSIASVSLGAERRFDFRHQESREKVSVVLEHGSLLVMQGTTQANWQHQMPKTKKVTTPRVNLTFRRIVRQ